MTAVEPAPVALKGVIDVDSHEMIPSHRWGDEFGPSAGRIAELGVTLLQKLGDNSFYKPDLDVDELPINDETVWDLRGVTAPSGLDITRRTEVMDQMGSARQLVFGSFPLIAQLMLTAGERGVRDMMGIKDLSMEEAYQIGRAGLEEFNDWAARATALDPTRMRAVGQLIPDGSVEDMVRDAKRIIDMGVRAIAIPMTIPPAGFSPAAPELDPFWRLMEESSTVVTMHTGSEYGFLARDEWGKAPAFKPGKVVSTEFGLEPYSMATLHYADTNYLTTLVYGGVFERFPDLRFGIIEALADWFGPLAENLDMWFEQFYKVRLSEFISMKPSEYLARNVRITPFSFEPVDRYLERHPDLATSYCYSTDYPHVEGGKRQMDIFYNMVSPFGEDMVQKFFYENGAWLFPE